MESIASQIAEALHAAHLTARDLAAISNVHYTTIYLIQRKGESAKLLPTVRESIEQALTVIHKLILDGKLPFTSQLSQAERKDHLLELVSKEPS